MEAARARLPYLDGVLREAMRLFPPARHIDRCPMEDTEIGGEIVRRGDNVVVSPAVTHREPDLHRRSTEFDPDRWIEPGRTRRKGAYLPFGAGVHTCIGEPLARATAMLVLAAVGQRWRLETSPAAGGPGSGARDGPRPPGVDAGHPAGASREG